MKVVYLTLGEEKRPFSVGFGALTEFCEQTGKKIDDLNDLTNGRLTLKEMVLLIWCGLKEGARKTGQQFTASQEDVCDWLDDNPGALLEFGHAYGTSKVLQKTKRNFKPN